MEPRGVRRPAPNPAFSGKKPTFRKRTSAAEFRRWCRRANPSFLRRALNRSRCDRRRSWWLHRGEAATRTRTPSSSVHPALESVGFANSPSRSDRMLGVGGRPNRGVHERVRNDCRPHTEADRVRARGDRGASKFGPRGSTRSSNRSARADRPNTRTSTTTALTFAPIAVSTNGTTSGKSRTSTKKSRPFFWSGPSRPCRSSSAR